HRRHGRRPARDVALRARPTQHGPLARRALARRRIRRDLHAPDRRRRRRARVDRQPRAARHGARRRARGPRAGARRDVAGGAMTQDRWTAVDRYVGELLVAPDPALDAALEASAAAGLPAHQVSPAQGKLLWLLARQLGARRILEIGTLGGYSAIWLA